MTTETNIMEKIVSWPTSSVMTPSDRPVRGGGCDQIRPGRAVRPAVDPLRHLGQEIAKQAGGRRVRFVPGAGAEDPWKERRADGLIDAGDQAIERRGGGEVRQQFLM